jgi:hypothetical protein
MFEKRIQEAKDNHNKKQELDFEKIKLKFGD